MLLALVSLFSRPILSSTSAPDSTTSWETWGSTTTAEVTTTPEPTPKPVVTGEWCAKFRSFISLYDREENKFYGSLDGAKSACEKDAGCGAVGLDRIPYRKVPGGPVIHAQTIYLVSAVDVETRPVLGGQWRFNTFVKGPCAKEE